MEKKKFFYGWVVAACLFLIAMLPMVFISNFFSYYQVPISTEFNCSYSQFSVANVCSTIANIAFSLLLASKLGKGNTRMFMLVGGLVCAAAYYAQSYITAIWQLYITFAIANFSMASITYVPINLLISQWFIDRKAQVTSMVLAGGGVGGMLFSGFLASMLAEQGWRYAFRVTSVITAVVVIIAFILIRKTPQEMGLEPYRKAKKDEPDTTAAPAAAPAAPQWIGLTKAEAVKTGAFIFYGICLICCGIVAAGVFTQIPTYLIDNAIDYAAVMAVYSGVQICGQLIMGPVVDKIGLRKGAWLGATIASLAMIGLVLVTKLGTPAAYIAMCIMPFGSFIGGLAPPLLTGALFGFKDYSGIYGLGNSLFMAGCMIGPMLSSSVRDFTGSYVAAWLTFIAVYLTIALSITLAIGASKKYKP